MLAARTVLGDVPGDDLGPVDYHEHLFQVSPLLVGDELDDLARSTCEAVSLKDSGFTTMVEATPTGLGRDPQGMAAAAAASGMHVVATTGMHREAHYATDHWLREQSESDLVARFVRDVTEGMPVDDRAPGAAPAQHDGRPVRAGLIKGGADYWTLSDVERRTLAAVGAAHAATGAPVMVHLEHGSAAFEVLDLLAAQGCPADRVVLAHVDRNPDPGLHADLAAAGAYLGYDGWARHRDHPDSVLLDCLVSAASRGAGRRIVLGGDVARATRYLAYGGMPGLRYLGARVLPRLRELDPDLLHDVTVANPARLLSFVP